MLSFFYVIYNHYILFCRSAGLAHVNAMLREQLDQATSANQSLSSDIQKLTVDWQNAREDLELKEQEWREEEKVICTRKLVLCLITLTCVVGGKANKMHQRTTTK